METHPVDLVQSVRLQNNGANHTLTRGRLHLDGDFSVPDVELAANSRGITLLGESERGTIRARADLASGSLPLVDVALLGEVEVQGRLGGTLISGAVRLLEGVAVRVSLSRNERSSHGESRGSELQERGHDAVQ